MSPLVATLIESLVSRCYHIQIYELYFTKYGNHHNCKLYQHFVIVKATTAELGLPASFILCKVEDELQQLYLQVFARTR